MRILSGERKREGKKWFLRGFVALLFLALVSSISPALAVQSPVISVQPATVEASQGDNFTIDIVIDPKGEEIYAAQYNLYFNMNLLNATSQTCGSFLSLDGVNTNVLINKINNTIGEVGYAESRMGVVPGVTSRGTLATITFEVIAASGTSDLKLSNVQLVDPNITEIEVTTSNGICSVGGAVTTTVTSTAATHVDITVEEAQQMLIENPEEIILLDVRTKAEYDAEHIPDAKHIPVSELENRISELDNDKNIIVHCKSGGRSRRASDLLVQHGFEHVYNTLGGIQAWRLHFPIVKPVPTATSEPEMTPSVAPSPLLSPTPVGSLLPTETQAPVSASPEALVETPEQPGFGAISALIGLIAISLLLAKLKWRRS